MSLIRKIFSIIVLQACTLAAFSQTNNFRLIVLSTDGQPLSGATATLFSNSKAVKAIITNAAGVALFTKEQGVHTITITHVGNKSFTTRAYKWPGDIAVDTIIIQPFNTQLGEVSVTAKPPVIQRQQGKVILDVGASVTNTGSTVLEVLERSPGVMVDRNGGISLNGKAGVMVMIDDKPTYLSGTDLSNLLTNMNANQVTQIELIATPGAKYDASGNAGIINIKTKRNKQKGFNGSFTTAFGQGRYPKNTNSLILNYRVGKVNTFLNYNLNYVEYLTDIYALRKYFDVKGNVTAMLNQNSYMPGSLLNNTIKTGLDYYVLPKTTLGFVVTGANTDRDSRNDAIANWLNPAGGLDSAIKTDNTNKGGFKNGSINLNARHTINDKQDLAIDLDLLHYDIQSDQHFKNTLQAANGYTEISRGSIPTVINILSGKADYTLKAGKTDVWQFGTKSSYSKTDNTAAYENFNGNSWDVDNSKTNHFIYNERINAGYASFERKLSKLNYQLGLRYEYTRYDAKQLGNATQKDSSFASTYGQFFPSGYASYALDSINNFTFTAGRRIDRPVFQNLNPFYFIINKYTYSTGNPFLKPQFSWNFELSHQYKQLLNTAVSYADITNYFSQIFLADANQAVLLYTQGNVGRTYNLGISTTLTTSPAGWWSLTLQALYNHKQLKGFNGNTFTTQIDQLNLNTNNQFTFGNYTAELSGFYTTRARNDVQELLYPTGQLSVGLSRPIFNKKATLKLTARDLFYTNAMEGLTSFPNASEYFLLKRDSRVVTLSFTYRFGKSYKATKRSTGSATDEADRVGNG